MGIVSVLIATVVAPTYLARAHSHNDYERARPLEEALEQGFASIEADIYLVDGELRVGHDPEDLVPGRTLRKLYLDPLAKRAQARTGWTYSPQKPLILLVDIKRDGPAVYAELRKELDRDRGLYTELRDGKIIPGPVTVILSGDRPIDVLRDERQRFAFIDGRLGDLGKGVPTSLMPLVSDSYFTHVFPLKASEREPFLKETARRAAAEGKKLRFWAAGDSPASWELLWRAKVDLIGTDRPAALADWMRGFQR